jgi:hypothetical protein
VMVGQSRTGKRLLAAIFVAPIVLASLAGVPLVMGWSSGLIEHTQCQRTGGSWVERLWTPVLILNSPYLGNASASALLASPNQIGSESVSLTAQNGATVAIFSLDNWSVSAQRTVMVAGPGIGGSCASPFQAVDDSRSQAAYSGPIRQSVYLQSAPGLNDQAIPDHVALADPSGGSSSRMYDSVVYDATFRSSTLPAVVSCQDFHQGAIPQPATGQLPVSVPVWGAGATSVEVVLPSSATFSYNIPATAQGTWQVDDLASGGVSGLAFEWSACAA